MMNTNFNILLSLTVLVLTGCGSSSDDKQTTTDDSHDHEIAILVSQSNTDTLSLLEEGVLETLESSAAGNSATLLLSETGAFSAVLANETVNFVHGLHEDDEEEAHSDEAHEEDEEAHVLDFSLSGSKVITTNGHFAVLNSGVTTFVAYEDLETMIAASEDTSSLSVAEVYPALILDEEHDLKLVFSAGTALVFEGAIQEHSMTCATPTSHGQINELVVVSCAGGAVALTILENEATAEHVLAHSSIVLDGTAENYVWQAQGHVIVGFEPDSKNYAIIELDENDNLVVVKSSDTDTYGFTQNICNVTLDSQSQDILTVTSGGTFVALDHEADVLKSITLDESSASVCGDFVMASAAKTVLVVDNKVQKGYEIDVDEPDTNPNGYHVHERFDLTVSDIVSMVIFHEAGEDEGDHEH